MCIYVVGTAVLLIATPFDLAISEALFGGKNGAFRALSEMVYVPPFLIGYFGIAYYVQRFNDKSVPRWVRNTVFGFAILGVVGLSVMFFVSMRFLPYYQVVVPFLTVGMIAGAVWISRIALQRKWFVFDYLSAAGMGMIVTLFFVVTLLKRLFGRARFYVVVEDDSVYSAWYHIQGMVYERDFYSIPSGHISFATMAVWFVVAAMLIPRLNRYVKPLTIGVVIWIVGQGLLRVFLGEHFLTDVAFSVVFSAALMHLGIIVTRTIRQWLEKRYNI